MNLPIIARRQVETAHEAGPVFRLGLMPTLLPPFGGLDEARITERFLNRAHARAAVPRAGLAP